MLVQGVAEIGRLGAALNTSLHAVETAARALVDLLIAHHAPWSEIDLHLREPKLARLSELGVSLYAAHETHRTVTRRDCPNLSARCPSAIGDYRWLRE